MKNLFLILALTLGLAFTMEAKEVQGTIIFNDDSTQEVTFLLRVGMGQIAYSHVQQGIRYLDKKGKKQHLSPDDAKEILFTFKGKEMRMVSIPYILKKKRRFVRLDVDGKIKLFTYISSDNYFQYIQTADGDFFLAPSTSIKKIAREKFQDCPKLIKKVESKAIKYTKDLVIFYNQECG